MHWPRLGQVKMHGQKCKDLGCGCCVAFNRKEEDKWKQSQLEIQSVLNATEILLEIEK